jgi:HAD superfamily hydrolase (TIGR01549 family)
MAIKSISDLYNFSLFIFDLDNTIYNEKDYLFQAYMAIADKFARIIPSYNKNELYHILKDLYMKEGRERVFDKFLDTVRLDHNHMPECLEILRTFKPEKPLIIDKVLMKFLRSLIKLKKSIYILTNGNTGQQKNKIKHIQWDGLDEHICFVFADEIEPKPSPAGVFYILRMTGFENSRTIFIGDKETDRVCAENSNVSYFDIKSLTELFLYQ